MQNNNAPVSAQDLRKFGFIFAGILILIFGLLLPYWLHGTIRVWPFYIGLPVVLLAAVVPTWLRPLYVVWMKFGAVMGFINTHIIMFILFYGMLTPIGWLLRLFGKDLLAQKLSREQLSYRVQSQHYPKEHMEKPY
jgi:endonuclease/exonuclease/phosphatase (EEP) superfamily protein YafD